MQKGLSKEHLQEVLNRLYYIPNDSSHWPNGRANAMYYCQQVLKRCLQDGIVTVDALIAAIEESWSAAREKNYNNFSNDEMFGFNRGFEDVIRTIKSMVTTWRENHKNLIAKFVTEQRPEYKHLFTHPARKLTYDELKLRETICTYGYIPEDLS